MPGSGLGRRAVRTVSCQAWSEGPGRRATLPRGASWDPEPPWQEGEGAPWRGDTPAAAPAHPLCQGHSTPAPRAQALRSAAGWHWATPLLFRLRPRPQILASSVWQPEE